MYHVCHKCGLPRSKDKTDKKLGSCTCIGQTWFSFEEVERTEEEAISIAREKYEIFRKLFESQEREPGSLERLYEVYRLVLEDN